MFLYSVLTRQYLWFTCSSFVLDISSSLCALALRIYCDCDRCIVAFRSRCSSGYCWIVRRQRYRTARLSHRSRFLVTVSESSTSSQKMHLVSLGLQPKWSPPTRVHSTSVWLILYGCSSEDVTRRCRWDAMIAHIYNMIGDVAQWSGRRSLAGGLSLIPDL